MGSRPDRLPEAATAGESMLDCHGPLRTGIIASSSANGTGLAHPSLTSERGIAWRVADSLSLRSFLDLDVTEAVPNHSTLSRTRRLIDVETHGAVFTWVLERLSEAGLVRGKTVGVDATTLEANAAMRSIERRDTGESYEAFLQRLAEASGLATPTRAELARFDPRSRKDKKTSNKDWQSPQDPDAKITKMKVLCHYMVFCSRCGAWPGRPAQQLAELFAFGCGQPQVTDRVHRREPERHAETERQHQRHRLSPLPRRRGWLAAARSQEVRAVEGPGAAGPGCDGPPRHVRVRAVPGTRDQSGDALPVRRSPGRATPAGPEGPRLLNRSA